MSITQKTFRTARPARFAAAVAAGVLALTGLTACGSDDAEPAPAAGPALSVEDPWVRATTGAKDTTMTAAFMVLDNETESDLTITGATSEVAGMVQIHDMVDKDGVMAMQELPDGLKLAPRSGALLQPGGKHLMMMDLNRELAPGDEVTFTITYGDGKTLKVTAPVKEAAEEEGHYHAPGTDTPNHGHTPAAK